MVGVVVIREVWNVARSQRFKVLDNGVELFRMIHRMTVYERVEVYHTGI